MSNSKDDLSINKKETTKKTEWKVMKMGCESSVCDWEWRLQLVYHWKNRIKSYDRVKVIKTHESTGEILRLRDKKTHWVT